MRRSGRARRAGDGHDSVVSDLGGVVDALARYPVKSLRGQSCPELRLDAAGVEGDRRYALYGADGKIGSGKTTRRFRKMSNLLEAESWSENGTTVVRLPSSATFEVGDPGLGPALSELVGEPVEVRPEGAVKHLDDSPVHLVTTASLRWVASLRSGRDGDPARFRPNVVIDVDGAGRVEGHWIGRSLSVGPARLRVTRGTVRCVMPAMAQGSLPRLPYLLADLEREADLCLGVYAEVEVPGTIRLGDRVEVLG